MVEQSNPFEVLSTKKRVEEIKSTGLVSGGVGRAASLVSLVPGLPFPLQQQTKAVETPTREIHSFEPIKEQLAHNVVIFPKVNRVVVNEHGAFVPRAMLGPDVGLAYTERRPPGGGLLVTIFSYSLRRQGRKRRKAGSAEGLITMAEDFDAPLEDFQEYME